MQNDDDFDLYARLLDPADKVNDEGLDGTFDDSSSARDGSIRSDGVAINRSNQDIVPSVELTNKVTNTFGRSASNKVTRRRRRSDSKDRQIIDGIRNSVAAPGADGEVSLVGNFHGSILNTSWEHTGDRMKLAFANEALELREEVDEGKSGARPVSWSLNLGSRSPCPRAATSQGLCGVSGRLD